MFILIAVSCPFALPVGAQTTVIAVVDGARLQRWEVERELALLISVGSYHRSVSPERRAELEQEALDRLILKELQSQWLRERGITVDPADVEREWRAVRQRFDSEEAYQDALHKKGLDDTGFRRAFERDAAAAAAESEVLGRVDEPTELEAEVFFLLHRDEYRRPEARHAIHALVYVPKTATVEQWDRAKERAQEVVRAVREEGTPLIEVALELRDRVPPQHRDEIGDLGFIHRGSLQPALDEVVFTTAPGGVTDPVRSIFGYHVIQVTEVRPPKDLDLDEVRDAVMDRMSRERRAQALAEFADSLRAGAEIEVIAWPDSP